MQQTASMQAVTGYLSTLQWVQDTFDLARTEDDDEDLGPVTATRPSTGDMAALKPGVAKESDVTPRPASASPVGRRAEPRAAPPQIWTGLFWTKNSYTGCWIVFRKDECWRCTGHAALNMTVLRR